MWTHGTHHKWLNWYVFAVNVNSMDRATSQGCIECRDCHWCICILTLTVTGHTNCCILDFRPVKTQCYNGSARSSSADKPVIKHTNFLPNKYYIPSGRPGAIKWSPRTMWGIHMRQRTWRILLLGGYGVCFSFMRNGLGCWWCLDSTWKWPRVVEVQ